MKDFVLCVKTPKMFRSERTMIREINAKTAVARAKEHYGEDAKVLVLDSREAPNPFS